MVCKNTDPCFFDMLDGKTISCKNLISCQKQRHNDGKVSCTDRRSSAYHLENPDGLTAVVVRIDGGVIRDNNTRKCDYALLLGKSGHKPIAILVELKGSHVREAFEQIKATLYTLKDTLQKFSKVYGRIIINASPDIRGPDYNKFQKWLKSNYPNVCCKRQEGSRPIESVTFDGTNIVLK